MCLGEQIDEAWMTAWQFGQFGDFQEAVVLALTVGIPESGMNSAWLDSVPELLTVPEERTRADVLVAAVRNDWEKLGRLAGNLGELGDKKQRDVFVALAALKQGKPEGVELCEKVLEECSLGDEFYFLVWEAVRDMKKN